MDSTFPPLDNDLSPYTGWTRAHWENLLARMTYGYAKIAELSGSPARVLYPDDRRGLPDSSDAIESFARIASAWGAWLRNPANSTVLNFQGYEVNVETLLRQALLDGTDTNNSHPNRYGNIGAFHNALIHVANISPIRMRVVCIGAIQQCLPEQCFHINFVSLKVEDSRVGRVAQPGTPRRSDARKRFDSIC